MPKDRSTIFISYSYRHSAKVNELVQLVQVQSGDLGSKDDGRIWFRYADAAKCDADLIVRLKDGAYLPLQFKEYRPSVQVMAPSHPPQQVKRLLRYALPLERQEEIIGDLEEEYCTSWLPEHGSRDARRLYWWHAIRSIAPMLWAGVRRSAIITAIVGAAQWLVGTRGG